MAALADGSSADSMVKGSVFERDEPVKEISADGRSLGSSSKAIEPEL